MVVLNILFLYGAYTMRVFSDHGIAVATRAHFLLPERGTAAARSVRDYFLWTPVRFMMAPLVLIGGCWLLAYMDVFILAMILILAFPVIMGALAASAEQRAGQIIVLTAVVLGKIGINGGEHRSFTPPKMSEPWPD
jgi:small-conductance mechanosensitive channel